VPSSSGSSSSPMSLPHCALVPRSSGHEPGLILVSQSGKLAFWNSVVSSGAGADGGQELAIALGAGETITALQQCQVSWLAVGVRAGCLRSKIRRPALPSRRVSHVSSTCLSARAVAACPLPSHLLPSRAAYLVVSSALPRPSRSAQRAPLPSLLVRRRTNPTRGTSSRSASASCRSGTSARMAESVWLPSRTCGR